MPTVIPVYALRRLVLLVLFPTFVVAAVSMPTIEKGEWVVTGQESITDSIINAANVTVESGGYGGRRGGLPTLLFEEKPDVRL